MVSFWFDFIKYFETFPKLNTKLSVYDAWVSDSESILMTSPGLNTFSTFCRWRLMTEISWRGSWHHQPSLLSTALILVAVRFRICDFAMYYKLLTNLRCFFFRRKNVRTELLQGRNIRFKFTTPWVTFDSLSLSLTAVGTSEYRHWMCL